MHKYLVISQVFYPDSSSVGQHMYDLARKLVLENNQVTVITANHDHNNFEKKYKSHEIINGIEVIRIGNLVGDKKLISIRIINQIFFTLYSLILSLTYNYNKLILTTNPAFSSLIGCLVKIIRRKKIFFWVMDINPDQAEITGQVKNKFLINIFNFFNKCILKHSDQVITLDKYMKKTLLNKKYADIKIIPPWPHIKNKIVNDKKINNLKIKLKIKNKFIVMYSGNITNVHPLNTLIGVAKKFKFNKKFVFLFIGEGNYKKKIIQFKKKFNLNNIILHTYFPLENIDISLSMADLHVVSMGNNMVGIVHPCKIYNIINLYKPILYLGPKKSHIGDLMKIHKNIFHAKHDDAKTVMKLLYKLQLKGTNRISYNKFFDKNSLINRYYKYFN